MSLLNKITTEFINKLVGEFKKKDNKTIINDEIIHPMIFYISNFVMNKLYPFLIIGTIIFILTFIFSLIMLILIIRLNFKN